jgi:hypothetical protein
MCAGDFLGDLGQAFSRHSWRAQFWSLWGFCCATCSDPFRLRRHHRRHHRSPAMTASPAGQDRGLGQRPSLGTRDSDALFAAEVHPFLGGKLSAIRPNFCGRVFTNASASLDSRVRILSGQPRSSVSGVYFPQNGKASTFPRLRLAGAGLWPAISGIFILWARVSDAGLCSPFSNFRFREEETGSTAVRDRFEERPSRKWARRRRDPTASNGSSVSCHRRGAQSAVPARPTNRAALWRDR